MKFITLDPETFREFAEHSPFKSFMQTPEIAKYRENNGWTSYFLGVEEQNKLVAATMLVAKPTFLGKSTFLAPGGPLLDFENHALVTFFLRHLKSFIKAHNGFCFHIDPYYELIERDRDGNVIEGGFNHTESLKLLKNRGFKAKPHSGQPQYLFVLDFQDRTHEQIFAEMKRNTRNHIRKAEKTGVKVRELKREELNVFKQITESTSKRRNFTDKPLSYYEEMYDLFHKRGEVKFILAEVTTDQATIPLSAAMFMTYGDEVIYLFSGSDENYMKEYNAQYLIQWHMIKYAVKQGFKRYNFYGINGLPDKSQKDYGIYDFKKGFTSETTGHVVELIGAYETATNQIFYQLHHLLSKLKHR